MSLWQAIIQNIPEVQGPTQKFLSFKEKVKWILAILVLFFVLGLMPLFGLGVNALQRFETFSIILGAEFGSLISLGIGPIVTASIVLQLLNGSGIVKFDLKTPEGKKRFQGTQKLLSIVFIILESALYVFMGGLAPLEQFAGTAFYRNRNAHLDQNFPGGCARLSCSLPSAPWQILCPYPGSPAVQAAFNAFKL